MMFGYHDSTECPFDLWSPGQYSAIENRDFSGYAKHKQECDDIVRAILNGQTSFSLDDDFSQSDLDYINSQLAQYGVHANLSLD